jgi:2,5-dioxopentanoate dehydrogenase
MTVSGVALIGVREEQTSIRFRSGIGESLDFSDCGEAEVTAACELADAAFDAYRETDAKARAVFLETIATGIEQIGDILIQRAMAETSLPRARLEGERGRTTGQLRLFAQVVRQGDWLGLTIDGALPERTPPRPDLRLRNIPVGPVAVFGASNFPLAFSVAGGDTASALAAGCPVVVKGHPAHPGTGELVARAVQKAVADCGLPEGVFSYLPGTSNALGEALVADPRIAAVGFTGSRAGGLALTAIAQGRHVPIPVYAEMSSINPVILLPTALDANADALAAGFVASLTQGAGQFCTNPGLILAVAGPSLDCFVTAASNLVADSIAAPMLTPAIHAAYETGVAALSANSHADCIAKGQNGAGHAAQTSLFVVDAADFLADETLGAEIFGPSSVIVRCRDIDELTFVLRGMEGQLTATLHVAPGDELAAAKLLPLLERKVGRILVNGWPTGVEVAHAMVHGGPYPATSDTRSTSVGSLAISRFLRPVCYQAMPQSLLPAVLRDDGLAKHIRRVDGVLPPASGDIGS